jgi:hypothetical protein
VRWLVLASSLLAACGSGTNVRQGCQEDGDCAEFQQCIVASGICACTDDNACDGSEFCNIAGRCQALSECFSNDDCRTPDNLNGMCDVNTGACVTLSPLLQCTLDSHCGFGAICEGQRCQTGCREDGDCPIGDPCINNQCDARPGACTTDAFCRAGELCNTTTLTCTPHREASLLCRSCDPADPTSCGEGFCLIDSSVMPTPCTSDAQCPSGAQCQGAPCFTDADCGDGTCDGAVLFIPGQCNNRECRGYYCGASSCSDTDPCPLGYGCSQLRLVSNQSCDLTNPNSCGANRACQGGGENGNLGFCSCAADADCPDNNGPVTCVNPGPQGACIIGTTCGPADGLLCEQLLESARGPQP